MDCFSRSVSYTHLGETKEIELVLREADLEDLLENISMPEFMLKTEDGTEAVSYTHLDEYKRQS